MFNAPWDSLIRGQSNINVFMCTIHDKSPTIQQHTPSYKPTRASPPHLQEETGRKRTPPTSSPLASLPSPISFPPRDAGRIWCHSYAAMQGWLRPNRAMYDGAQCQCLRSTQTWPTNKCSHLTKRKTRALLRSASLLERVSLWYFQTLYKQEIHRNQGSWGRPFEYFTKKVASLKDDKTQKQPMGVNWLLILVADHLFMSLPCPFSPAQLAKSLLYLYSDQTSA